MAQVIDDRRVRKRLREERRAAGFATPEGLAARAGIRPDVYEHMEAGRLLPKTDEYRRIKKALGDIPDDRLYLIDMLQLIGVAKYGSPGVETAPKMMEFVAGAKKLLVARDEISWDETRRRPDHPVDVFMSMSCGTQASPHLLQDTVAVANALGISFVATAGPAGCCGKPYIGFGQEAAGEGFTLTKAEYARSIGAKTTVVWCNACQQTATLRADRRRILEGREHPVRETQVLPFLVEEVARLGDRVPWKKRLARRVLVEGHDGWSFSHSGSFHAAAKLLAMIPGVEVVAMYDGSDDDLSPCAWRSRPASRGPLKMDETAEDVAARRVGLAALAKARGFDTVACEHQGCHQVWSKYASDGLRVQHAVSILAEALGCAHPDRFQAAALLGSPEEIVAQTRPVWTTWDIDEAQALELARREFQARYAVSEPCGCGKEGCANELIGIDVLTGGAPSRIH